MLEPPFAAAQPTLEFTDLLFPDSKEVVGQRSEGKEPVSPGECKSCALGLRLVYLTCKRSFILDRRLGYRDHRKRHQAGQRSRSQWPTESQESVSSVHQLVALANVYSHELGRSRLSKLSLFQQYALIARSESGSTYIVEKRQSIAYQHAKASLRSGLDSPFSAWAITPISYSAFNVAGQVAPDGSPLS